MKRQKGFMFMNKPIEITYNLIYLRPFSQEYAEEHLAGEDEEQVKGLSDGKSTIQRVRQWIEKNQKHWDKGGPIFNFAIFTVSNEVIGMIEANTDYKEVDGLEASEANIAYGLYTKARGKGYASKPVELVTTFLAKKGYKQAIIRVSTENQASLKVPIRCGFVENQVIVTRNNEKLVRFIKPLYG